MHTPNPYKNPNSDYLDSESEIHRTSIDGGDK